MRQKVKSLEDTGRIAKKSNKQKNKNRSTRRNKTYELTRSEAKILALHSRASQMFPLPKFGSRSSDFSQGRAKGNASC